MLGLLKLRILSNPHA